jgi:hypothetical protein
MSDETDDSEFQPCSFCDKEYQTPSIFISNYNEVWICRDCDNLMFPENNMENGKCCACLKNTHVLNLRSCIHKLCSTCFKQTNFGSTLNPKKWGGVEMKSEEALWPFKIQKADKSDPGYIKVQEYQNFFVNNFTNEKATYDEQIEIRNNLISTRPEWMNTEEFIHFENKHLKYIYELLAKINSVDDYKTQSTNGIFCPLCKEK